MATSNAQITIYLSIAGLGNCIVMICCTMTLHHVAKENFNLIYSLGMTGYGAGMVLLPLLAEFLRQAYGWRGGLLIISALMAHIIPVAMAIKFHSDDSSKQRKGFRRVPSSLPGVNEGEECKSITCQNTKGELDRIILVDGPRDRQFYATDIIGLVNL
eukprot:XP_011680003.1 PREDICTED: monocarboxylate transporter 11 [Strongylocentrotus purpuratus]